MQARWNSFHLVNLINRNLGGRSRDSLYGERGISYTLETFILFFRQK